MPFPSSSQCLALVSSSAWSGSLLLAILAFVLLWYFLSLVFTGPLYPRSSSLTLFLLSHPAGSRPGSFRSFSLPGFCVSSASGFTDCRSVAVLACVIGSPVPALPRLVSAAPPVELPLDVASPSPRTGPAIPCPWRWHARRSPPRRQCIVLPLRCSSLRQPRVSLASHPGESFFLSAVWNGLVVQRTDDSERTSIDRDINGPVPVINVTAYFGSPLLLLEVLVCLVVSHPYVAASSRQVCKVPWCKNR